MDTYDVIVIGAGHAGIEAALASSRMGASTLMLTLRADSVGHMSCNPAIGGVGKGQLVKEIDALGGEMGKAADRAGIQFKVLNASKGPAVQSSRAQIDRELYRRYMDSVVRQQKNLTVAEDQIIAVLVEDGRACGVRTQGAKEYAAEVLVVATGTFLNGVIHRGLSHHPGGRINEPAAVGLDENLRHLGFDLLRFKTGTCPRIDRATIDYTSLGVQGPDLKPRPFSFSTTAIAQRQVPCHITYTSARTHRIIRDNLDKSPLYTGIIKSTGVRYCPSIEDKVVKFSDKERHQVFLEPEGYDTDRVYPNGLSTSLPEEVQLEILHSIPGLERARILEFGYGIEHTVVEPTQLWPSLETKRIRNLFLAGQINGTTGYEEAAAQGLIAGINAALRVRGEGPFVLDRSTGYIGVLIDDLTTKGTREPYRMFTSRVEYRLLLREDNADLRLRQAGFDLGLVTQDQMRQLREKQEALAQAGAALKAAYLKPGPAINERLAAAGTAPIRKKVSCFELLKRPQIGFSFLRSLPGAASSISETVAQELEIEVKYEGFIARQRAEVERFKHLEKIRLPAQLDFDSIGGLSREIREKLKEFRPLNLGQASRISGITPAAVSLLMVYLKKNHG